MTKRRVRLFVYGTLQPRAGTPMGAWLAERTVWSAPASVPGRLHAIEDAQGSYPALLAAKGPARVQGMVCELRLKARDLARLDRYEGREYRRAALPVCTKAGRLAAQAYLWRAALPPTAVRIAGGDFLGWLDVRGGTPFGL